MSWDGEQYQARFDRLAAEGAAVHGEAECVQRRGPRSVLDAGCGTGRVAIELARRGVHVVGVDVDESMLQSARRRAPNLRWVVASLADPDFDLGETFDVVVMAGNVPLFTPPGTQAALVAGVARHVGPGGLLMSGFSLGRGYEVDQLDRDASTTGLELVERHATWDEEPWTATSDYAVSVHRRPVAPAAATGGRPTPPG